MHAPTVDFINDWIGRSVVRREDAALVAGAGRFVDDLAPAGCLHLKFLRSPYASGGIRAVDVAAAAAAPGVVAVLTAADTGELGEPAVNALFFGMRIPRFVPLARDRVEAVGHPVAAVIAKTPAQADDALERIALDIEPSRMSELATREPSLEHRWEAGDTARAFAEAAYIARLRIEHARVAPMALEPRAALAHWDGATKSLTAWLATQAPHRARTDLAAVLNLSPDSIRVIAPDVGGAFGGKASIYPEDIIVALASIKIGAPVKWCATRSEDFLAATHGRGAVAEGELAVSADGEMLALRARLNFPLGHWLPFSAAVPASNAGRILPGPYRVKAIDVTTRATADHTGAVGIYRGAGRPEAAMLLERLVDEASRMTGLDPIAFRHRNLLPRDVFPYRTPTGQTYDSGNYRAVLERTSAMACYRDLAKDRTGRRAKGEVCGVGIAFYIEPCGHGWESARIQLARDGKIVAATGTSAQGQGRETSFAQIVATTLGVPLGRVVVRHGDTDTCPPGIGALASRSTAIGGVALLNATREFGERAREAAARLLATTPEQLTPVADGFRDPDNRLAGWRDLADATWADSNNEKPGLETTNVFHAEGEAWASGCCIASVTVDRDTGAPTLDRMFWVDDAGTVINPLLVEGQLIGGMAQGIGEALMERLVYDDERQLGSGSLMDYAVPRAADIPDVVRDKLETPARTALGAKGVGEAGTVGIPAAIANAIADALAPFGSQPMTLPFTSAKIWQVMQGGMESGLDSGLQST